MNIYETTNEAETLSLGERMGRGARAGQVYTLIGDLGTGKTVFTKGFAKGLDIAEHISSPTFTIAQIYDKGRIPLYHLDVYRIGDISEMDEVGYEDYFYGDGVALVEWGDMIEEILPGHYTRIVIAKDMDKGFGYRKITIEEI